MHYESGESPMIGDIVRSMSDLMTGLVVDLNPRNETICVQFFPKSVDYTQSPVQYRLIKRGK